MQCDYCNKEIMNRRAGQDRFKKQFCSGDCYMAYRRDRIKVVVCDTCGKQFKRALAEIQKHQYHFCSPACYKKFQYKADSITCEICGKIVERCLARITPYEKHYCSPACAYEGAMGEGNHNWQGGITSETTKRMNAPGWRRLSDSVKERDGYICQVCGRDSSKIMLIAHHIIPYKVTQDDSMNNLIAVCQGCHMIIERAYTRGDRTWVAYFQGILVGRQYENAKQLLFPFMEVLRIA